MPSCTIEQWDLSINDWCPIIVSDNIAKDAINDALAHAFATKTGQTIHYYSATDLIAGSPILSPTTLKTIELLHSGRTSG